MRLPDVPGNRRRLEGNRRLEVDVFQQKKMKKTRPPKNAVPHCTPGGLACVLVRRADVMEVGLRRPGHPRAAATPLRSSARTCGARAGDGARPYRQAPPRSGSCSSSGPCRTQGSPRHRCQRLRVDGAVGQHRDGGVPHNAQPNPQPSSPPNSPHGGSDRPAPQPPCHCPQGPPLATPGPAAAPVNDRRSTTTAGGKRRTAGQRPLDTGQTPPIVSECATRDAPPARPGCAVHRGSVRFRAERTLWHTSERCTGDPREA